MVFMINRSVKKSMVHIPTCVETSCSIWPRMPHICWNCTLISLKVSVITAMKTFFTSHERKNIMVVKKNVALHPGNESMALYMMNTQPSCEAA